MTIESPFLLAVYANATTAEVMFTVPQGERERLDIYEDQIALVGRTPSRDYERFAGPPSAGLWIFEGEVSEAGEERATFTGTWRRPTATELSHIAAGTWPGVQVGA
jgi:hypothetical protein